MQKLWWIALCLQSTHLWHMGSIIHERQFQPHSYTNNKYGKLEIFLDNRNNKDTNKREGSTYRNCRARGRKNILRRE